MRRLQSIPKGTSAPEIHWREIFIPQIHPKLFIERRLSQVVRWAREISMEPTPQEPRRGDFSFGFGWGDKPDSKYLHPDEVAELNRYRI